MLIYPDKCSLHSSKQLQCNQSVMEIKADGKEGSLILIKQGAEAVSQLKFEF